mmetsp:Transcript_2596/g.5393  ORF Transcript_2596/g.5393 Transcript_2596/m.5393 type:complete len:178 (+) Transcript_2596:68-601(+)
MGKSSAQKRALARSEARSFYLPLTLLSTLPHLYFASLLTTFGNVGYIIRSALIGSVILISYNGILSSKEDAVSIGKAKGSSSGSEKVPGSGHIDTLFIFLLLNFLSSYSELVYTVSYVPPLIYYGLYAYNMVSATRQHLGGGGGGFGGGGGNEEEVDEDRKRRREERAKKRRTKVVR